MLIFTNILEMHCLKVANMYEHKYQYQYLGYQSDALTAPCELVGLQVWYADYSVYATCNTSA